EELDGQLHKLEHLIGTVIGGYEGDFSIQDKIAEKLTQTKQTIAFAESCTGGKITSLFTDIPGASAYLKGGFIPYATSIKEEVLGVDRAIVQAHSVVSKEAAEKMAIRVRALFQADLGLATTGNAG